MSKPRLLDLFCGAGGAAMGYARAGFDVVGVDIKPQPRYPFEFHRQDVMILPLPLLQSFDVIHASPPCQGYTRLRRMKHIKISTERYPMIIDDVRLLLQRSGVPYVIENVVGAPLKQPVLLCGAQFDLKVYRHRLFESSLRLKSLKHQPHRDKTPPAGRGVSPKGFISINSGGAWNIPQGYTPASYKRQAMDIEWMTQKELTESIPPAYTEYIGRQLIQHLWWRQITS